METRRYPVDTQIFSKIIEGNCVYVDKTDLVYKMTHDYEYVFLSRPRRFGKSLLCSTLDEYFNGNKDLFKGLKIDGLEKVWTKYPVINLSFASAKDVTEDSINEIIDAMLESIEKQFAVERQGNDCGVRFKNLIINIFQKTGQRLVVIIDEYDAAMLDTINNDELQERIRAIQNKFFSPLKDLGKYIRFVFITGITKFSQMSIFSTLNNLKDISLVPDFQTICGISNEELLSQLNQGIQDFADYNGYTVDDTIRYFKAKYDGYHFSPKMLDVYNPYSVINALKDKQFGDFWFNSGTPTALLKLISKFNIKMEDYEGVECSASRFNQPVEKVTDLVPFLFQSGYLTIKDYKSVIYGISPTMVFKLGYPNDEVRTALADSLFRNYFKVNDTMPLRNAYFDFYVNDDLAKFIEALKKFFRRFPFSLNNMNEKHYHSILYTVLTSFGADISANQETALGKSDLILRMPKTIYVIELKYDRSTNSALDQIDDRDYVSAVLDSTKRIVKLAIKFSSKERNIESYKAIEEKV